MLYNVEFISVFFNIERMFAIRKHVFVDMLNTKKFEGLKMCYIENIHKRLVAIINNHFCIFQIKAFVQTFDLFKNSFEVVLFFIKKKREFDKKKIF